MRNLYNRVLNKYTMWLVMRGSALLDRQIPGWYNKINVGTLDIMSVRDCVVAQVTQLGYGRGLVLLGKRGPGILEGFFPLPLSSTRLTRTWVKVILERREQDQQDRMFAEVNKILKQNNSMYRIS